MKKARRLVAVLVLVGMLVSFAGLAEGGQAVFELTEEGAFIDAMALYDSTLYIRSGANWYLWDEATGEVASYPIDLSAFEPEDGSANPGQLVAGEDGLYAIVFVYETEDGATELDEALLCPVAIDENGAPTLGEGIELDWEGLTLQQDAYEYAIEGDCPTIAGDRLLLFAAASDGFGFAVASFSLATGERELFNMGELIEVEGLCAYKDGAALLSVMDWTEVRGKLYEIDAETGALTELCTISDEQAARRLAYDAANDRIYFTLGGSLFAMDGTDPGSAVGIAAVPVGGYQRTTPALTADGRFLVRGDNCAFALGGAGAAASDPAGAARPRIAVNAVDMPVIEEAVSRFARNHPEAEVAFSQEYLDILSAMMTRSASVDIYVLRGDSPEYGALYRRGYLAELTGSAKLTGAVGEMYGEIQDIVMKDGELVALPVGFSLVGAAVNPVAMERMGLSRDALPGTWPELLSFLAEFPELSGDSGATAFEPGMDAEFARYDAFRILLFSYLQDSAHSGGAFDAEGLRALLAEFEKIDFGELVPRASAQGGEAYENSLLSLNGWATPLANLYLGAEPLPLPLALREGEQAAMRGNATVAIVNPYSENRELAIAFLEEVAAGQGTEFVYGTSPGRNEPIRDPNFDQFVGEQEKALAAMRAEREKADEKDVPAWEEKIREAEEFLAEYTDVLSWTVSPDSLAIYRAAAEGMLVERYLGFGTQNLFALRDEIGRYLDGTMSADGLIAAIENVLEMARMEGN